MPGFFNTAEYTDAADRGQKVGFSFRKTPTQASVAGHWVDLSLTTGNPNANYYVGTELTAKPFEHIDAGKFVGLYHGDAKSPAKKYLHRLTIISSTAALIGLYKMLDYVLFYPFIDMDSAEPQVMDNTLTLPRHVTGHGVRAMMVAVSPSAGGGSFTFDYVNQDGEAKTSPTISCGTTAHSIANIIGSQPGTVANNGPFLPLAGGDTGIRSITSLTNIVLNGGLAALVLVKSLHDLPLREVSTPKETEAVREKFTPAEIEDGAYLNLIMNCAGSVAGGTVTGTGDIIWN